MRTIVAGSRTAGLPEVYRALNDCPFESSISEVISGTARGADSAGEHWANALDIPVKRFPADWDKHGRSAGYLRNEEMANHADALVAVWDGSSRGTKHMIDIARRKGLEVFVYTFR